MAAVLVVALFIMTFNVQAFEIPTSSMENTLLVGDHVFVDRITRATESGWSAALMPHADLRRGDIIVFYAPAEPDKHLVKRVIGLPGDRIHLRDGVVYLNGAAQSEPAVIHSVGNYDPYRDNFPAVPPSEFTPVTIEWRFSLPGFVQGQELVVPPDSFFAMGDNRDVSLDSRYWGFVPRRNIIGRPLFVYWSFDTPPSVAPADPAHPSAGERARSLAYTAVHFFDRTRWRREFHIPR